MELNLYSIFDTVAQVFNKPFTEINNDTATRVFRNTMVDNTNKNDYVLYHLGTMTDHDGVIDAKVPLKVISGFDIKNEVPQMLQEQAQ